MPKITLRFEEALGRKLKESAEREGRSMQSEIVHRLQASFAPQQDVTEKDEQIRTLVMALGRATRELERK
jgi:hypothetical protein